MQALKVYCSVKDCRFPYYHVTAGHKCGNCKEFGHGVIECSYPKELPKQYWCSITECKHPNTHMNASHHCYYCGKLHKESKCLVNKPNTSLDPIFKGKIKDAEDIFGDEKGKVFCILMAGMGCQIYAKRDNEKSKIETFFMHSDSWGQYGPESDDRPKLEKFLAGYRKIG